MNIACILRSLSDLYSYEKKLAEFMEKQMGFLFKERVFKNAACIKVMDSNKWSSSWYFDNKEVGSDVGYVSLREFVVSFGEFMDLLPQNKDVLSQLISSLN